jgi:hypothetical protein
LQYAPIIQTLRKKQFSDPSVLYPLFLDGHEDDFLKSGGMELIVELTTSSKKVERDAGLIVMTTTVCSYHKLRALLGHNVKVVKILASLLTPKAGNVCCY